MWEIYLLVTFIFFGNLFVLTNSVDNLIWSTYGIVYGFTPWVFNLYVTAPI